MIYCYDQKGTLPDTFILSRKSGANLHTYRKTQNLLKTSSSKGKNIKSDLQKNEASFAQINCNYLPVILLFKSIPIVIASFFFHFSTSGLFAVAHDMKVEWIVVEGVCGLVQGVASTNNSWKTFACVMAASVVSNMLSNSFVFGDWPHYGGTCTFL